MSDRGGGVRGEEGCTVWELCQQYLACLRAVPLLDGGLPALTNLLAVVFGAGAAVSLVDETGT